MTWQDQIIVEPIPELCAGSDLSIANVARVSFNKWKEEFENNDIQLIKYLANHAHSSPFRHTSISIRCTAPIHLARQLVKHQAGLSWNEVSRRYVSSGMDLFKQEFRLAPVGSIKQGSGGVVPVSAVPCCDTGLDIEEMMDSLLNWYDSAVLPIEEGGGGLAPETVRGYMPLNMMTTWIWTGNLLAFHHMFNLRKGDGSQKEAQVFATKTKEIIRPMFPIAWDALSGVSEWKREQMMKEIIGAN